MALGSGIRDPRSGIRKKYIPDPGSRIQGSKSTQSRIPDPGSGSATLGIATMESMKYAINLYRYLSPLPNELLFSMVTAASLRRTVTGLWRSDDPATGLRRSDADATGLLRSDDPATGLRRSDDPATGLRRSDDPATGLRRSEAAAIGLRRPKGLVRLLSSRTESVCKELS
jgi:hypothetical protein